MMSWLLSVAGVAGESLVYFGTYTGPKSKGIYLPGLIPPPAN